MINRTHMLISTDDAEATREFFRDVLGLSNVDATVTTTLFFRQENRTLRFS